MSGCSFYKVTEIATLSRIAKRFLKPFDFVSSTSSGVQYADALKTVTSISLRHSVVFDTVGGTGARHAML